MSLFVPNSEAAFIVPTQHCERSHGWKTQISTPSNWTVFHLPISVQVDCVVLLAFRNGAVRQVSVRNIDAQSQSYSQTNKEYPDRANPKLRAPTKVTTSPSCPGRSSKVTFPDRSRKLIIYLRPNFRSLTLIKLTISWPHCQNGCPATESNGFEKDLLQCERTIWYPGCCWWRCLWCCLVRLRCALSMYHAKQYDNIALRFTNLPGKRSPSRRSHRLIILCSVWEHCVRWSFFGTSTTRTLFRY